MIPLLSFSFPLYSDELKVSGFPYFDVRYFTSIFTRKIYQFPLVSQRYDRQFRITHSLKKKHGSLAFGVGSAIFPIA